MNADLVEHEQTCHSLKEKVSLIINIITMELQVHRSLLASTNRLY